MRKFFVRSVTVPLLPFTTSHTVNVQLRDLHRLLQDEERLAYLWKVQSVGQGERSGISGGFRHLVKAFRVQRKWTVSPAGRVTGWVGSGEGPEGVAKN